MNLRQIKLVYLKEMKDILRDKRSLRIMLLIPVVVYPLMAFGFSALAMGIVNSQRDKPSPVMMVGSASHVRTVLEQASKKIRMVSDEEYTRDIRNLDSAEFAPAQRHLSAWISDPYLENLDDSTKAAYYYSVVKGKVVDCILEVPADYDESRISGDSVMFNIYYDEQEFRSDGAESKLRRIIAEFRDSTIIRILSAAGMSEIEAQHALKPFWIQPTDVAPAEKRTGFMLALMLPYMIVIMVLIGAMYPAIDLTAGEKERGTLETILASPAGRDEITMGKFLAVFTASFVTVIMGAISMTLTAGFGAAQMVNDGSGSGFVLAVNPASLAVVILLMLPTSVLFSAVLLAISVMARSFKEAQSYIQPMMILVILPSMVAMMPGIDLTPLLALVPVAGISLAVKAAMLTARGEAFPWTNISIVFASTGVYALAALFLVRQMFNKESVLFRT